MEMEAKVEGYISIGFTEESRQGAMDVVLGWVDDAGQGHVLVRQGHLGAVLVPPPLLQLHRNSSARLVPAHGAASSSAELQWTRMCLVLLGSSTWPMRPPP